MPNDLKIHVLCIMKISRQPEFLLFITRKLIWMSIQFYYLDFRFVTEEILFHFPYFSIILK